MKLTTLILSTAVAAIIIGCNNDQDMNVQINPLDQLEQVDKLLSQISKKPQHLTAPSNSETTVTGAKGTVIHVDPKRLETIDGSPLGDNIQIELLELTDNRSMLLNNTQTVSNGQILVTGGAYYLNMTSDGKQLKLKQGKGLEVEFPKLTENEMGLFLGEQDSLGQMNWVQAEENFEAKDLEVPEKPKPKDTIQAEFLGDIDLILGYTEDQMKKPQKTSDMSDVEFEKLMKDYERKKAEIEYKNKTYQAIEIMNFGWINCDRFLKDPSPKTEIQLLINNDSLEGARLYAVFTDIKSVMTTSYYKGMSGTPSFRNIPSGRKLQIIAVAAKNKIPYVFEKIIETDKENQVQVDFVKTTLATIEQKMISMN